MFLYTLLVCFLFFADTREHAISKSGSGISKNNGASVSKTSGKLDKLNIVADGTVEPKNSIAGNVTTSSDLKNSEIGKLADDSSSTEPSKLTTSFRRKAVRFANIKPASGANEVNPEMKTFDSEMKTSDSRTKTSDPGMTTLDPGMGAGVNQEVDAANTGVNSSSGLNAMISSATCSPQCSPFWLTALKETVSKLPKTHPICQTGNYTSCPVAEETCVTVPTKIVCCPVSCLEPIMPCYQGLPAENMCIPLDVTYWLKKLKQQGFTLGV